MIYLTDYRLAYSTKSEPLEDLIYPQRVHWFSDTYNKTNTGLFYPPHKLADKVLDPELIKKLKENPCKTAFILAAGNTHFAGMNGKQLESRLTYDYKLLPLTLNQVYAGRVAQQCGASDLVYTDASACASSLKVMTDVINLIKYQGFDRVIILSFEDAVSNNVLKFFGEAQASLTLKNEQEFGVIPSAFDSKNYGFYVAQGAVFAVFESAKMASNPKAILCGAGIASEESTNPIGQREDGQGFIRAIQAANQYNFDISVVKTHGTGTKSNNLAEANAIKSVFGNKVIATSFKPTIGHTMGASGLLETCLLFEHLNITGKVPGIKNRTEKDDFFVSEDTKPKDGCVLSLAAGMGNIYSAAIFARIQ